jgi:formate hydrogenlyase subunit 3/multisubunit Na+/H+ antiporter MnhD subunit
VQALYFKTGSGDTKRKDAPVSGLIPMFLFMGLIIVMGIYPGLLSDVLRSAASELLNRVDYIRSVIG